MEHKIYVHDGSAKFDINKFREITNREHFVKPFGGLWAFPEDSDYTWTQWVENNNFNNTIGIEKYGKTNFKFTLKENARLLSITSIKDLDRLPKIEDEFMSNLFVILDFEKLAEDYDAIEVSISSDYGLYEKLYGWDIDSLLVFNADVIKEI